MDGSTSGEEWELPRKLFTPGGHPVKRSGLARVTDMMEHAHYPSDVLRCLLN